MSEQAQAAALAAATPRPSPWLPVLTGVVGAILGALTIGSTLVGVGRDGGAAQERFNAAVARLATVEGRLTEISDRIGRHGTEIAEMKTGIARMEGRLEATATAIAAQANNATAIATLRANHEALSARTEAADREHRQWLERIRNDLTQWMREHQTPPPAMPRRQSMEEEQRAIDEMLDASRLREGIGDLLRKTAAR